MKRSTALLSLLLVTACASSDPFQMDQAVVAEQSTWMAAAVEAGDPNAIREKILFGNMFHPEVMADGLMRAAEKGDVPVAEALLQSGAPLEGWSEDGLTPLMVAAAGGHDKAVSYLISRGANARLSDVDGLTPLHYVSGAKGYDAASGPEPRMRVIARLIKAGGPIDAADKSGRTPLHHAVATGDVELVRALLAAGASPQAADKEKITPAALAVESGAPALIALFASAPESAAAAP
ncbi:MAG: ankyrin repeat domain-containing protein [Nitrospirota bacterium]|nr:ankyrin repeat domain-containing protein [Nitrospirota bacterium]